MKKTAIVTGGTKNHFPAMATLALNLAEISPNVADEFVFFHDGVPEKEIERLRKAVEGVFTVRDILYKSPFSDIDDFTDTVSKYFSLMVFCKYECWKLLDDYACVIWSDYDVCVLKDIADVKIRENYSAKFISSKNIVKKFNIDLFWKHEEEIADVDFLGDAISCPIFVLYDSFPDYDIFYQKCVKLTLKFTEALYLPEEAIISLLFQRMKILYDKIDANKYCSMPQSADDVKKKSSIFHAVGQPKFWNGLDYAPWQKYYEMWHKKYGGRKIFVKKEYKMPIILKILRCFLPHGFIVLYNRLKTRIQKTR